MSDQQTGLPKDVGRCRSLIERHVRSAALSAGAPVTAGPLACDSIALAEVIVSIEEESGVVVPMDERTARALRSISSFAELLCGLAEPEV